MTRSASAGPALRGAREVAFWERFDRVYERARSPKVRGNSCSGGNFRRASLNLRANTGRYSGWYGCRTVSYKSYARGSASRFGCRGSNVKGGYGLAARSAAARVGP